MQIKKLEEYCKVMLLDYNIEDEYLNLGEKVYRIVLDKERQLFNEEMDFLEGTDYDEDVDGYVFEFGGRWYLQDADEDEVQLNELKYIGNAIQKMPTDYFLGMRSSYELMNGMGLHGEWIKKAKFLGVKALGCCERKSLSGVLSFQSECINNDIKPIVGMTIPIKGITPYEIKLYVKNFQGWQELLKFNKILNVEDAHYVLESFLIENSDNLFIVADPKSMEYGKQSVAISEKIDFYQLDTVRFLNEETDTWYLENLKNWILSDIESISITDAFYLEQEDHSTREVLWSIGKAFDDKTNNQFFKTKAQYAGELINLFEKGNRSFVKLFHESTDNEKILVDGCNFVYDTQTRHLPKYIMTEEEQDEFESNEDLFIHLIQLGFKERGISGAKYIERVKAEIEVLKLGDVIDYFLSLYDIVRWSKSQGFLTGIGRGSAGGSLVAYLLGIIQVDPLKFDLLFERFLNSGRMGNWEDRPLYTFEGDGGEIIELAEGDLARIIRNGKEIVVYCNDIIEGDEIIKY